MDATGIDDIGTPESYSPECDGRINDPQRAMGGRPQHTRMYGRTYRIVPKSGHMRREGFTSFLLERRALRKI